MDLLSRYNKSIGLDWDEAEDYKYYYNRTVVQEIDGDITKMNGGINSLSEHVVARILKKDTNWSIKEPSGELVKIVRSFDTPVTAQITISKGTDFIIVKGRAEVTSDYVTIIEAKVTPTTIMSNEAWTNRDTWNATTNNSGGYTRIYNGGGGGGTMTVSSGGRVIGTVQSISGTVTFDTPPTGQIAVHYTGNDQGNVYGIGGNAYTHDHVATTSTVYSPHTRPGVSGSGSFMIDSGTFSTQMLEMLTGRTEEDEV